MQQVNESRVSIITLSREAEVIEIPLNPIETTVIPQNPFVMRAMGSGVFDRYQFNLAISEQGITIVSPEGKFSVELYVDHSSNVRINANRWSLVQYEAMEKYGKAKVFIVNSSSYNDTFIGDCLIENTFSENSDLVDTLMIDCKSEGEEGDFFSASCIGSYLKGVVTPSNRPLSTFFYGCHIEDTHLLTDYEPSSVTVASSTIKASRLKARTTISIDHSKINGVNLECVEGQIYVNNATMMGGNVVATDCRQVAIRSCFDWAAISVTGGIFHLYHTEADSYRLCLDTACYEDLWDSLDNSWKFDVLVEHYDKNYANVYAMIFVLEQMYPEEATRFVVDSVVSRLSLIELLKEVGDSYVEDKEAKIEKEGWPTVWRGNLQSPHGRFLLA